MTTAVVRGRRSWTIGFLLALAVSALAQDASLPELTRPVNDFAGIIDADSAAAIEQMIRTLQAATGDVVIVATVPTIEPYGDIKEYANKLFENHGRGIGQKGKDNGLLILVSVKERKVWIEVGYTLEQWVTDGYAGETSREVMVPEFRNGRYGPGLRAGAERIIGRIAQGRNVTLQGVRVPTRVQRQRPDTPMPLWVFILIVVAVILISRIGGGGYGGRRYWGGGPWSGWSSGGGSFGGGGGFGGGFGGFGGGSSGGGGGGGSW